VCPSQALAFGTREEMRRLRPGATFVNTFQFGAQTIQTKVNVMVPEERGHEVVDVTAAMYQPGIGHDIFDSMFGAEGEA
jgi:hypothetical protein